MEPASLLKRHGLSKTTSRLRILEILNASTVPQSGKDICTSLDYTCDKSTVYRTLNSLYEKGALQRIIMDHEVKYALRGKHGSEDQAAPDHLHFKCSVCSRIFCFKDIKVSDFELPDGFIKEENQFLIIGKCKECL